MPYPDYYALLGVPRFYATQEEIRNAYIKQIRFFHPDIGNVPPEIAKAKTQELNNAYETLSDPVKKRSYDEILDMWLRSFQDSNGTPNQANSRAYQKPQEPRNEPNRKATVTESYSTGKRNSWIGLLIFLAVLGIFVFVGVYYSPSPARSTPAANQSTSASSSRNNTKDETVITDYGEEKTKYIAVPQPDTGALLSRSRYSQPTGPLEIVTRGTDDYVVKLRDVDTGEEVLSFYVRAGETAEVEVPLGSYELSYACGQTWYGTKHLFGDSTRCAKADEVFTFELDGRSVTGWTVELYLQTNGNLSTESIDLGEF